MGALSVCLMIGLGAGPFTPLALDRAERDLARGDLQQALRTCELTSRWGLLSSWRAQAHYRSATLQARHLGQPAMAVNELRGMLAHESPEPIVHALALQLLAECLESRGRHRGAAKRYEQLARVAPEPAPWFEAAALAWERASRPERALLRMAAVPLHDPDAGAHAHLAMGRIALGLGRTDKAYAFYAQALRADANPEHTRLARLGMAMALDDMGRFEQALAELEEAAPERDLAIGIAHDRVQRRAAGDVTAP